MSGEASSKLVADLDVAGYLRKKAIEAAEAAAEARDIARAAQESKKTDLKALVGLVSLVVTLAGGAVSLYVNGLVEAERQKVLAISERLQDAETEIGKVAEVAESVFAKQGRIDSDVLRLSGYIEDVRATRWTAQDAALAWQSWRREYDAEQRFAEERHKRLEDKLGEARK